MTNTNLDRAIGALLGLACGDAVGTTVEFRAPGTFAPIDDMVGGGPFRLQPGQWTDDTSMALCLAESLLDTGAMDLADQLRRYTLWRDQGHLSSTGRCFDIGITVNSQLSRFARTGEAVDPHIDQESAANGSLMRLAPVPIRWHADLAEAAARSGESSTSTHAADRPVDACRLMGSMVAALIGGASWDEVAAPDFWQWGDLHPQVAAIAAGSWRDKEPPAIKGTGFCIAALEAAVWALDGADDVRAAVLRATNLGDDADTTAAIAGQLAGARWGASGIPTEWRSQITLRERIETMAERLYLAGSEAADGGVWPHDHFVHTWRVGSGTVLAGEYPADPVDPIRTSEKVNLLCDAGVRTFVDLTTEHDGMAPYDSQLAAAAQARGLDLRHVNIPITDMSIASVEIYDQILGVIHDAQERGIVYVHCWGGIGRTGTVIGCLLVDDGHDADDALRLIEAARADTKKARRTSPETAAQIQIIRDRAAAR